MLYCLQDVMLEYGPVRALEIPELHVLKGERLALLGPNGSGKSSLLKLMDGLIKPSSGSISCAGEEPGRKTKKAIRSIYMHQYPYLLAGSAAYNIAFGSKLRNKCKKDTEQRVRELCSILALETLLHRPRKALSGGEAQRVALARTLAADADILLLDEPSASADRESQELILKAIERFSSQGKTLIFSSHDEVFAKALSTRTIRLQQGKILGIEGAST